MNIIKNTKNTTYRSTNSILTNAHGHYMFKLLGIKAITFLL